MALGTVAAIGVGLATWLSVRAARAERERDAARGERARQALEARTSRRALGGLLWVGDTVSVRGTVPVSDQGMTHRQSSDPSG